MTSKQVSEWLAYDSLDPIGKFRDELGWAQLSALISNIVSALYGKKGTSPKRSSYTDFMPQWGEDTEENDTGTKQKTQSVEEMKKQLLRIARISNKPNRKKARVK